MALKSFSIKIGADTKDFTKGLKDADKAIKSTVKEGKALKENLKLDYSTKGFEATQKTYQHALNLTNQKAQALRDQLRYLEENGGVNTDSYYDLQTKLAKAEIDARNLKDTLEDLKNVRIENLTNKIDKLGKGITSAGKSAAVLSAAAAGLLVGSYKLANDARNLGDEISTLATKYDMSAESIQRWKYFALQTDVASENVFKGMTKVRDAIGTIGSGESNNATRAIDIVLGGVNKLSKNTESAFSQIIEVLSNVKDSEMQAYYANEIFGEKLATELIPLIRSGSGVLNELNNEFETVGYLTDSQVQSLSRLDNSMNKIESQLANAKTQLGIALIPILQQLTNILTNYLIPAIEKLTSWFSSLPEGMQKTIITGLTLIAVLSPILLITGKIISAMSLIIGKLPSLASLITRLNTPLGKTMTILSTIAIMAQLIHSIAQVWSDMSLGKRIAAVLGVVSVALGALAIMAGAANSALTIGAAAAAIVGGIVAVTAAVNGAKNDAGLNINDYSVPDLKSGNSSYNVPSYNTSAGNTNNYSTDNSQYNITVNMNASGELNYDASQIADEVIKKIVVAKQSSGR